MIKSILQEYILNSNNIAIIIEKNIYRDGEIEKMFDFEKRPHMSEYRNSSEIRDYFHKYTKKNLKKNFPFKPNNIYKKILKLDTSSSVRGIINMNIDGILKLNGAKNVIDLEGNLNWLYCSQCGMETSMESFANNQDDVLCSNCKDNSLKINLPFNGQEPSQWDLKDCWVLLNSCDLLILLVENFISPITFSYIELVKNRLDRIIITGNLIDFTMGNTPEFFSDSHYICSNNDFLDILLELTTKRNN